MDSQPRAANNTSNAAGGASSGGGCGDAAAAAKCCQQGQLYPPVQAATKAVGGLTEDDALRLVCGPLLLPNYDDDHDPKQQQQQQKRKRKRKQQCPGLLADLDCGPLALSPWPALKALALVLLAAVNWSMFLCRLRTALLLHVAAAAAPSREGQPREAGMALAVLEVVEAVACGAVWAAASWVVLRRRVGGQAQRRGGVLLIPWCARLSG
ncbi:hypothetical protein PLESTF_001508400 [Pleodorina starrii]|nr:hypothetical protein PLESTM_000654500 [Pleodorina starrii]GLC74394.1 hypothetical protein PLESTF_001508400 [Pleodorina starrii]